jgi:phospholipid/cholesterol/gamma-HCH transport system substrate-binding protein
MDIPRRLALRVGGLVAGAVAVGFMVIWILGSEGMMFASARSYQVAFRDVGGLREGAVVRLGGLQVGDVTEIRFAPRADGGAQLVVSLRVRDEYVERVRADSLARISSQGLLGDKLIEITLGSAAAPAVEDGGWLVGEVPGDPNRLIATATAAAEHARNILARFDEASKGVDGQAFLDELGKTVATVRRVAERVESGPGTVHELIYGETLAGNTARALAALERAAAEGQALMVSARKTTDRLEQIAGAVDPARVTQMTSDLASMAADMRAGRGTLGGLIADPTLYEETKRILVNIRRNRVLRSLARMVISEDMPDEIKDARPAEPAELDEEEAIRPRPAPATRVEAHGSGGPVHRP